MYQSKNYSLKAKVLTLFILFLSSWTFAQIVTTNPTIVTQNGGVIEVTFDATQGTKGLMGYTGDVYAHTGVNTNLGSWQHAPTWGDNSLKYKLTPLGNDKWKFTISPDIATFYALSPGETVNKLCFVFRSADKTKEGKDIGGTDIFYDVSASGLNVVFTNPVSKKSATVGTTDNITFTSSIQADLELLINGVSVKTATAATTLSYSYTYSNTIDYQLIAKAVAGGVTKYDTVKVSVAAPVVNQPRPSGYKDGITYSTDGTQATLIMYAPGKTNVFVIGDMNNWSQNNDYQLKKDGNYWWITLTGLTPGKLYGFQYLVDGTLKVSDPYTELVLDPSNDKWINQYYSIYPNLPAYPVGKTDGLVATLQTAKTAYNWQVPNFTMPSKENMVIYETLLRDFTPEKSLTAAIAKLDYLKNLGITAVELMPIQEFDGNNSWGYNPNHYFAPDKAYGTSEMYKQFIDECHKRGMAVILDMVFNQASGLCPFAMLYWDSVNNRPAADNPWMNPVAPHPYSVFNDFNHNSIYTKAYFDRVLQYWITEYKVDGYRMDLAKGFTQNVTYGEPAVSNYDQSRVNNLTDYYNAAKSVKSDVMFILEFLGSVSSSDGNAEENQYATEGIYLWRNLNYAYSQSAEGYQSGSDFGSMVTTPRQWVGYAESHDEERNFYNAKISGLGNMQTDSIARVKRVPLNVAFTALLPGPKMIYEFGEMGYDYSINSNGGRTNDKSSAWGWLNLAHRKAASDACAKILTLRKMYPVAFTSGTFALNIAQADWNAGRRIALTHSDLNMVVLGNFNANASINANPNFPKTGIWYNLLTGETLNVTNTAMTIPMQAGDLLIYTDRVVNLPNGIISPVSDKNSSIYPTITNAIVYVSTASTVKSITVYNIQGAVIKTAFNTSEVDLSNVGKGLYLIEVNTLEGRSVHKVIKE